MTLKIKICGITNPGDAQAAVEAGANALGFMFHELSPRNVSLGAAANIIRGLPPFVARVGVFVNAAEPFIRQAIGECGIDTLQFHGEEPPEFCRQFAPLKRYKSFRVRDGASLKALPQFDTDAWLLDSCVPEKLGGTGAQFNWDLAVEAKQLGRPIILAGGLTPENVAAAVRRVQPYAVDVSSGVESAPGRKDARKLRDFIVAASAAAQ